VVYNMYMYTNCGAYPSFYSHKVLSFVDKIKILGIVFAPGKMAKKIEDNWEKRVTNLLTMIKEWCKRDLSIQGKIIVIKTFLISQFTYVMQSVGLPKPILINVTLPRGKDRSRVGKEWNTATRQKKTQWKTAALVITSLFSHLLLCE